jgi:hypothetical protein
VAATPTSAKPGPRFERGEAGFEFKIEKIGAAPHGQCRTTPQHSLSGCDALNTAANRIQRSVDVSGQVGRTSYHGREYGCENQSVFQQVLTRLFPMQVFDEMDQLHFELLLSRSICRLMCALQGISLHATASIKALWICNGKANLDRFLPG